MTNYKIICNLFALLHKFNLILTLVEYYLILADTLCWTNPNI